MKIGIILADKMEYLPFTEYAGANQICTNGNLFGNACISFELNSSEITVIEGGIGKVNAAAATAYLIASGAESIILAGLSGGIKDVDREDIVIGTKAAECDVDFSMIGYQPGEKPFEGKEKIWHSLDAGLRKKFLELFPFAKSGTLGCGDLFLNSKEDSKICREFDMTAFDMESGAVAAVCDKAGVPCAVIRKISDDADENAKDDYRAMNDKCDITLTELLMPYLEVLTR